MSFLAKLHLMLGLVGFLAGWILTGKMKCLDKCMEHYMLRFVVSVFFAVFLILLGTLVAVIVKGCPIYY